MRYIYLSPHLDDAVLSAGGLIYEQTQKGTPVEIWTFLAGFSPEHELTDLARSMHRIWGMRSAAESVRVRRAEDLRAAAVVGAKAVHFDFVDAIYRRDLNGEHLYTETVSGPPHPAEADLPAQIAQTVLAWVKPDDVLICQLAIGDHVDHVVVRRAMEMLKLPLVYDADIPYLLNHPEDLASKAAGLKDSIEPISEAGFDSWMQAINAYASQLSSLFASPKSMQERMRAYWLADRGIRLWRPE
jgi:LmbE family N-acetylglucosaminyl deacetylase